MNKQQYLITKQYFIDYINNLLNKTHIINKTFLIKILNELNTNGYITETNQYQFLLKFLKRDRKHKNINIDSRLYSLEKFIKNPQQPTLEKYFI
jgi:hypothetical protein